MLMTRLMVIQDSSIWTHFCGCINFASICILYTTVIVFLSRHSLIFRSTKTTTLIPIAIISVSESTPLSINLEVCQQFAKENAEQQIDWHFHDHWDIFVPWKWRIHYDMMLIAYALWLKLNLWQLIICALITCNQGIYNEEEVKCTLMHFTSY